MTSTQQKFMNAMQRLADEVELDLVVDTTYANCGRVIFQPRETFDAKLAFTFNFQQGYASFQDIVGFGAPWTYTVTVPDGRHRTISDLVAHITTCL